MECVQSVNLSSYQYLKIKSTSIKIPIEFVYVAAFSHEAESSVELHDLTQNENFIYYALTLLTEN